MKAGEWCPSAVLGGAAFLGRPTRQARIVFLTEENRTTLVEKVDSFGLGDVDVLTHHGAGGAAWPTVVEEATLQCRRVGADLLVIDTLAQSARLPGDSENDAGTALDQMRPLQHAAGTGLAVLVVSHQRKSEGEFGDAIRGSNATAAAVDVIVEVERPKNLPSGNLRTIKAISRFGGSWPSTTAAIG